MRTQRGSALCFLLVMVASCTNLQLPGGSAPSSGGGTVINSSSDLGQQIVAYTNEARARNGLPDLVVSSKLTEAARIQAQQMAAAQRADHTINGAEYPTLQSRLQAVSYAYSNAAENVAWNQRTANDVVTGWMNSTGHRANILNPQLTQIGAAMERSAKGEPYWVQVFGTPR